MDRQDIDALLVGALYGELSPAEEARLATHLEAHPADRGALDDLKSARAQVRESRVFQECGTIEPPQHISALLLQEAHRRAPKSAIATEADKESSWFLRFTRMFLAHPAMAAAAMLVLVLGVAGTLYSKKGSDFASRTAPSQDTTAAVQAESPAMVAQDPVTGSAAAFNAQLADESALAEGAKQQVAAGESASDRWEKGEDKPVAKPTRRRPDSIAVMTEQQQPKDLERAKDSKAPSVAKGAAAKADLAQRDDDGAYNVAETTTATTATGGYRDSGRAGTVGGAAGPAANTAMAQPPPPPSADNFAAAPKAPAPESKPSTVAKAPPTTTTPAPADSTLIAWAKSTHSQVAAKVKAGDCQAAAKLALTVSNRAPDYYSQYMATDRQLKSCKQYIDSERDKDAERANKTRAQKRVNAEESMPSPSTK